MTDNDNETYNKQCNNQLDHDKLQRQQTITKMLFKDNEQQQETMTTDANQQQQRRPTTVTNNNASKQRQQNIQ